MSIPSVPLNSLMEGNWFKLICGASYGHLPAVRNLALVYSLAGADCIDVSADQVVVEVALSGLKAAQLCKEKLGVTRDIRPWLMISLNDGGDPHFRKATFDPLSCPPSCPRPCENICPTQAIQFSARDEATQPLAGGVIEERCYGCGRCLDVCPAQVIQTRTFSPSLEEIVGCLLDRVDALEIHTQVGREEGFQRIWDAISPSVSKLQLVSISCPDGENVVDYLWTLCRLMVPPPRQLLWQVDGRPMSGDIGMGTTHQTIRLARKILRTGLPGFVQLAGGTNHYTVKKLEAMHLLRAQGTDNAFPGKQPYVAGIAYGSYARKLLLPTLTALEALPDNEPPTDHRASIQRAHEASGYHNLLPQTLVSSASRVPYLEMHPQLLQQALHAAKALVGQLKSSGDTLYFES